MSMSLLSKLNAICKENNTYLRSIPKYDYSDCFVTEVRTPLDSLENFSFASAEIMRILLGSCVPEDISPDEILYLDTETTGLSGGAGTVAFLTGIGYIDGTDFLVKQYLMRDYPEEKYLLAHLAEMFPKFRLLVTFNGVAFDVPLLRSRFLMNRMQPSSLEELPHGDLLTAARRVFKLRLGHCNLTRLEEAVFREIRQDDLPGALVPERYFRFLKTGDFSQLEDILKHNAQDIISLYRLLARMAEMYACPEKVNFSEDVFSMGKALEKCGCNEKARVCYRLANRGKVAANARFYLGISYRRNAEYANALAAFDEMINLGHGGIIPYIEAAKIYEHRLRDPERALNYTMRAIACLSEVKIFNNASIQETENALQLRYQRLMKKTALKKRTVQEE